MRWILPGGRVNLLRVASDETTHELASSELRGTRPRVSLLIYHRDGSELVTLEQEAPVVVGRASPAEVVVDDKSLSREHARFLLERGGVSVRDLGSTNGTFVNDERITEVSVRPGDRIRLGLVHVALHVTAPSETIDGLIGYDDFMRQLAIDVNRGRALQRRGALLMVRGREIASWHAEVNSVLRSIDRVAAYGASEGLIWLEAVSREVAEEIAGKIARQPELLVGVALFPETASSADELVDAARTASHRAASGVPSIATSAREGDTLQRVVKNESMKRLYRMIDKVAKSAIPVLINGETGTGKEVIARAIHEASPRREGPMRSINCGAIPHHLIESELFGHEKGAFTGADRARAGLFEEANGGTVLLDEIGELSPAAQVALLRVLEERRVRRVGTAEEVAVDVRVLAATHRDLSQMVQEGGFRQDLFYRLNVMVVEIPPLRQRKDEILPLAEAFRESACQQYESALRGIDDAAARALESYEWPGNVRELRNVIDRAVVIADGEAITPDDLPRHLRDKRKTVVEATAVEGDDLRARVKSYEKNLLLTTLESLDWNLTKAAEKLSLPYRTLTAKMKTHGLKRPK